jgi:hypothetical protein
LRRYAAALFLALGVALLLPGAVVGEPDTPGDPSPPVVTPMITGTLGNNGWYVTNVTVGWKVEDPESVILSTSGCDTTTLASDTTATTLTCSATSDGGTTTVSKTFKRDNTAPSVTATPGRLADSNGWYNHSLTVGFSGADATSGVASCAAPKTYSGPDDGSASVSGTCTDNAGNVGSKAFGLSYDATAPSASASPGRNPDSNGWYNHDLTVNFSGSDATSGIDTCTAPKTYSGPDSGTASVSGSCRDKAGNQSGTSAFSFSYDATSPQVTGSSAGRQPDANGWYNQAVSVTFSGADGTSGVASCTQTTYSGPDSGTASVSGSCRDKAGNQSTLSSFALKYDATKPSASAAPSRGTDSNGWYNHALTVSFSGSDATSGIAVCSAPKNYSGPDNGSASVSGTCTDNAGNSASASFALSYDATAPGVTPSPGRSADSNGWYNHSLTVSFVGSDATSGVDTCTAPKTYSSPDTANASVSGSCRDKAGNQSATILFGFSYDATNPQVTGSSAGRQPDANGWYNHAVSVSFSGMDATSGIASCTQTTYSGPDAQSASVSGTCTDTAGNQSSSSSFGLKYDATKPSATAAPSRSPDSNGWYNYALSVSFSGSDATSGIAVCTAPKNYSGPDNGSASVSGTCTDNAGNASLAASFALSYDATAPAASASTGRQPDANGWYNHALTVSFSGTDATSGLASCTSPETYSGPDSSNASVSGSCRDNAGNVDPASAAVKYDATAPSTTPSASRGPDANGWYNHPLTVGFSGTDATSGIASCSQVTYSGPDAQSASVSGTCTDTAGNKSRSSSFGLKYDATGPQVTNPVPVRPPDQAGWYNHPIVFAFSGSDATSGLDSCTPTTYSGPDGASASVTGACFDLAGNLGTGTFPVKYDGTGPAVTPSAARGPDADGWYNHPLTVSFDGIDGASGVASCAPPRGYDGPDSAATAVTGSCLDKAGNVAFGSLWLKYDATAPQVLGATTARGPDSNGWFNHPLTVDFHGSDATSQIAACTEATYAGPDNAAAIVSGSCRDHAGNTSGSIDYGLKYDATPPAPATVTVSAGNRMAVVRWKVSDGTTSVDLVRFAGASANGISVYRGTADSYTDRRLKNGVRYRYQVRAFDDAGNGADSSATAAPRAPLYLPAAGAKMSAPPLLAWAPAPRARYYNVQVWRGRKIFSAWPTRTRLRLTRSWTYRGREYHLTPGRYRWYVWPGYGARAAKRYGRLLGASSFVVVAR